MRKIAWLIKYMDHKKQLVLQSKEYFLDMNITRNGSQFDFNDFPWRFPGIRFAFKLIMP